MLSRVVQLARKAAEGRGNVAVFVCTEDDRIAAHAAEIGVECIMTPDSCENGSERVLAALKAREADEPDFVINLQGDAPFTPLSVLNAMLDGFEEHPYAQVITPVHRLSWADLDRLRTSKKTTPFSGTTAVVNNEGYAMWFSKNILPAIRKEEKMREESGVSPVYQHMGLYGFRLSILRNFCSLQPGIYETLEGLEQLRMIENGIQITAIEVEGEEGVIQSGIDTPEDVARVEAMLGQSNG